MTNRQMLEIPISAAKEIADSYGYDQVVIIARRVGDDPDPHGEHVTTYGRDKAHCGVAARVGNYIKHKIMGWPEYTPAAQPADALTATPPKSNTLWRLLTNGYDWDFVTGGNLSERDRTALEARAKSTWAAICTEVNPKGVHAPPADALTPLAFAVPHKAITASLMRDDGGERPTYCVMVAYPSEADARAALSLLSADSATDNIEKALDDALRERDEAEDFCVKVLDLVLGDSWHGWSSAYGTEDALRQVEEMMFAIDASLASARTAPTAVARFDLDSLPRPTNPHDPSIEKSRHFAWARGVDTAFEAVRKALAATPADLQEASTPVERLTRYCPGCGHVGPVEDQYRDCCPDGNQARMIPEALAKKCRDTFKLAITSVLDVQTARRDYRAAQPKSGKGCVSDLELLELAARAAGLPWDQWVVDGDPSWDPLLDDGDALRLAVKLRMPLWFDTETSVIANQRNCGDSGIRVETGVNDLGGYAATRRAIVRAAADIALTQKREGL
ncbi:hypothetical protein [Comamonas odontotermitis]|uniref:hypothetical protein n=1 Tax=Comamonas odontotermitis TaxID=379895 RepID=UPI003751A1AB